MLASTTPAQLFISLIVMLLLLGCGDTPTAGVAEDAAPDPTLSREAVRLAEIADQTPIDGEPWQTDTKGTVIELFPAAVKLKTESRPNGITLATSADLKVYAGGNRIDLSDLQPGARITTKSERRGSVADGWQSLVVQIDVSPQTVDLQGTDDGGSDTLNDTPG